MCTTPLTEKAKLDVLQCGRPAKVRAEFAEQLETKIYALTNILHSPEVFEHLSVEQRSKLDSILTG
jgi:hypothetical protein